MKYGTIVWTALLAGMLVASGGRIAAADKVPVILDTDIGDDIDDTWALTMLLKSPQFDLKLVSTTRGKAEYRAKLVAKILTVAGRTDIPVALGEGGHDGTGGQEAWVKGFRLSDYRGKVCDDGAAAILQTIRDSAQPITVIAIGPLETLAAVVRREPETVKKAFFVGMHGSVYKGYGGGPVSAEWNVRGNAAAAKAVLSAPWRQITVTPLDTCGLVKLAGERFQTLKQCGDPRVKAMLENYRIWAKKADLAQLNSSSTLFDTVAIYLAYPEGQPLVEFQSLKIKVTDDGFTRIDPAGTLMRVATAWKDLTAYEDLLVRVLCKD